MQRNTKLRTIAVGGACAAAGAVAGITGAAAAPASSTTTQATQPAAGTWGPGGHGPGGGAVHATAEVLNRAGTAFISATEDAGTVKAVSGDQLTVDEAVGTVQYRTVTLTIPSGATVSLDFKTATLSDLKSGDHVRVQQSSDGTSVLAYDTSASNGSYGPGRGYGPGGW